MSQKGPGTLAALWELIMNMRSGLQLFGVDFTSFRSWLIGLECSSNDRALAS